MASHNLCPLVVILFFRLKLLCYFYLCEVSFVNIILCPLCSHHDLFSWSVFSGLRLYEQDNSKVTSIPSFDILQSVNFVLIQVWYLYNVSPTYNCLTCCSLSAQGHPIVKSLDVFQSLTNLSIGVQIAVRGSLNCLWAIFNSWTFKKKRITIIWDL